MPFANVHEERERIAAAQPGCEVREITGTGTYELPVDGIVELEYVRVGETVLPLEKTWTYLANAAGTKTITETLPFVEVYVMPDGHQILRRDLSSNHGIWQAGVTIYVGGVWEKDAEKSGNPQKGPLKPLEADKLPVPPPAVDPV